MLETATVWVMLIAWRGEATFKPVPGEYRTEGECRAAAASNAAIVRQVGKLWWTCRPLAKGKND